MSKFERFKPGGLRDYPLSSRRHKVGIADFGQIPSGNRFKDFWNSLPRTLAARDVHSLVERIRKARDLGKPVIWAFGGHVIKVGLSPLLIELATKGFVSAFATNGSGLIHDFEIALCGGTSEDVEAQLPDGSFGMARETGEWINEAICRGREKDLGAGESVGQFLQEKEVDFSEYSLLVQAYRLGIPLTVHVGIGTDIIHNHPTFSGEATGKCSQIDFQILTKQVAELNNGGVFLNVGSAVILPEVFLKAVSLVRNSGLPLEHFTTANLDFVRQYRPIENVVRRPVAGSGTGIDLVGHHEIMVPLLAAALLLDQ